jgi:hypothetical protein
MHPKFWKFPGAAYRDEATGDDGGKTSGGSGVSDADKAAADKAAADKAAADKAAADKAAADKKQPTDEEAKLIKEVMQKKDALKAREAELATAQERLKAFEGIDPDAVRKLLADQKAAEEAQLAAKGEFDTLKARMAEEHTKATASLQEQIKALQEQVRNKDKVVDELSIGQQFAQSKFISEESTMAPAKARKLYGEHFDVVDGKVVAYDKPRGEANRTPLIDQYGNGLAFEDAMRKIVEADPDKDSLLRSKVKPGAGSESKTTPKPPAGQQKQMDSVSKISAGLNLAKLLDEKQP